MRVKVEEEGVMVVWISAVVGSVRQEIAISELGFTIGDQRQLLL